jgi:transmembrane sensor
MQLLQKDDNDDVVRKLLDQMIADRKTAHVLPDAEAAAVLQAIFQAGKPREMPAEKAIPVRSMSGWRIAAAVILVLLGTGAYLWLSRTHSPGLAKTEQAGEQVKNDVAPGGNKAVLTLANGSVVMLDSAHTGILAQQGNSKVVKLNSGQLAYNIIHEKPTEVLYNTLATPRGGQYQLVLPDGSKVWLNAASSIHYPTAFAGKERKVEITGEAYFEVAKNENMPFAVMANGVDVQVLGTYFNVNAYADEGMVKTTLLEGAVRVTKDAATALLQPGEQAQLTKAGDLKLVHNADVAEAVAWKNGLFQLNSADIPAIMRQVARWYDVEIVYEEGVPDGHISGKVPRGMNLSQVLEIFEVSGVHFKIEGKKIVVMK